jgi:hypothetical protein
LLLFVEGQYTTDMSLTTNDLQAIRLVVRQEVRTEVASVVTTAVTPFDNRLKGLESDVKEIYSILVKNKLQVV